MKCSYVCKNWRSLTLQRSFWLKWSQKFRIKNEINELIASVNSIQANTFKLCFKQIICQKRNLHLFKLHSKISKKLNKFTNLPDLSQSLNTSLNWYLNIYDNRDKLVEILQSDEEYYFEGSCSIIWYKQTNKLNKIAPKFKIFASIPVYLDLNDGKLVNSLKKSDICSFLDVNQGNKYLVYESKLNTSALVSLSHIKSMIEIFRLNKELLVGSWLTSSNDLAFLTFNKVFDFEFISLISNQKIETGSKRYSNDLELDSRFGLHDYQVYFCIRNQTNTIFFSLSQHVYSAEVVRRKEAKYISLTVVDSESGYQLSMLPKLTWNTESLKKNVVDLISIIDFVLFDSNGRLIISDS